MWQILVRFSSQLLEAHLAHKQLDYKRMRTVTYNIVSMGKCALQRNKDFLPPPLPTSMSRSHCLLQDTQLLRVGSWLLQQPWSLIHRAQVLSHLSCPNPVISEQDAGRWSVFSRPTFSRVRLLRLFCGLAGGGGGFKVGYIISEASYSKSRKKEGY